MASHLTAAEIEAFALAENRISDDASFDQKALREIIASSQSINLDFDLSDTAFDAAEIDLILLDEDDKPEPKRPAIDRSKPAVSRPGDCWRVGPHAICCGDARNQAAYDSVLFDELAHQVIADLPYNLRINGVVSGLGSILHAEFPMASGEMSVDEFTDFIATACKCMVSSSKDGSIHYLFMDHRHIEELLRGAGLHYGELLNLCVWVKSSGGMGSLYRSRHELVFVYKAGKASHINNVELGRHERNRTNVWEYAGANSFGTE